MSRWRYEAVPAAGGASTRGAMTADSAADVRASLRRLGMRTLRVREVRLWRLPSWAPMRSELERWLRSRRGHGKAELLESLATMLDAGVTVGEALATVGTVAARSSELVVRRPSGDKASESENRRTAGWSRPRAIGSRRSALSELCIRLCHAIRAGASVALAAAREPTWFDAAEVAMIRAGEHRGEIASVLRSLSERHERRSEIGARLTAALAYPAIVGVVGVGVVVFLSTSTLPQLTGVLLDAGVGVPPLTLAVMGIGRAIVGAGPWLAPGGIALIALAMAAKRLTLVKGVVASPRWTGLTPRVLRESALATAWIDIAELLRVGVPLTDALRVVAPTLSGLGSGPLRHRLRESADRIERGESFGQTLDDPALFDAEIVRLVGVGEAAGDLHAVLAQVGRARARRARRLVDRLAAMLEPAVVLVLAALVGLVVMSAVLPMLRLQEVI